MGHQHHFLSRLDRVTAAEVELALQLYRDHALVRALLGQARLPARAERVAISLAHPARGPFLIVTRDGHFVTCLGHGMSPHHHPVITRKQLDRVAFGTRAPGPEAADEGKVRRIPRPAPTRAGRCPCGSGSRYEHCCAEAA